MQVPTISNWLSIICLVTAWLLLVIQTLNVDAWAMSPPPPHPSSNDERYRPNYDHVRGAAYYAMQVHECTLIITL